MRIHNNAWAQGKNTQIDKKKNTGYNVKNEIIKNK
jgi:hypothetical protein